MKRKRPVLTPLSEEALEYLASKERREPTPQRAEDTYHTARDLFEEFFLKFSRSKK